MLYLLPSPLGPDSLGTIPPTCRQAVRHIRHWVVETGKVGRAYLKQLDLDHRLQECTYYELNKRTRPEELPSFLAPIEAGEDVGLISDAGAPGVADPGSKLVRLAHARGIRVVPLVGPSAILLALMASGLNGQRFTFNGYLSPKRPQLAKELRKLEADSRTHRRTHLWIETPYRNNATLETCLETLQPTTLLCVAADLTTATEYIRTATVADWRASELEDLHKRPAIFLLLDSGR